MADNSFSGVVANWIDDNAWPRSSESPQSIVVLTAANHAGTVFSFRSAFSFFEIDGTYNRDTNALTNVQIKLVVPGKHSATVVAAADSYILSTEDGKPVTFNFDNHYVHGSVSFKYAQYHAHQHIFVKYETSLPFAGVLEDTVDIAPTEATEYAGFSKEQLKATRTFTSLELKETEALVSSKSQAVSIRTSDDHTVAQQELLVKFLRDFVVGQDSVVIETYYPPNEELAFKPDSSSQWQGSISLLGVLELVGSVDPAKLTISAVLYANVPIIKHVRLTGIEGALLGGGVSVDINVIVAKGKVTFTAKKNSSGKHELFVDAKLKVKFHGDLGTSSPIRLFTLP